MEGKKVFIFVGLVVWISTAFCSEQNKVFDKEQICKAAISLLMGVEPKKIRIDKQDAGATYLSYWLANEKERYGYKCKLIGNKIIWGSKGGRWRSQKEDSELTFSVDNGILEVVEKYKDESKAYDSRKFTSQEF